LNKYLQLLFGSLDTQVAQSLLSLPVVKEYVGIIVGGRLGNDLGTTLEVELGAPFGSALGLRLGLFALTKR